MNYAELITESEDELNQIEKRQKLVQFQKRIQFLLRSKANKPALKNPRAKPWAGNCDRVKRSGSCIAKVAWQPFCINPRAGDLANSRASKSRNCKTIWQPLAVIVCRKSVTIWNKALASSIAPAASVRCVVGWKLNSKVPALRMPKRMRRRSQHIKKLRSIDAGIWR